MGWTIYDRSLADPQGECDRLCTWSREGSSGRVVASALVGNTYYAAVDSERAGEGRATFAAVFLIQRSPFGYKDMDESMGPCEASPPLRVLEKLTPLPARSPVRCTTCDGSGKLSGDRWDARSQGAECMCCKGEGATDRHDYARNWRRRAWERFGGEPQGQQLQLLAS